MKRKDYEKPTMNIVQLQQETHLMEASSGEVKATMNNEWDEEDLDINPSASSRVLTTETEEEL